MILCLDQHAHTLNHLGSLLTISLDNLDILKEDLEYQSNLPAERRVLWSELGLHKNVVRGSPWILMGDFNVALNLEDSISGSSRLNAAMYDFKACVNNIEVVDINSSGLHYTWNQKPRGGGGILKKLDRIMGNMDFVDSYPASNVKAFTKAKLDEERFLKQKAKIEWLDVGDSNSAFFHKFVKSRNRSCRIEVIRGDGDTDVTGSLVAETFISHYQKFLGTNMTCEALNIEGLFIKRIFDGLRAQMVRNVTNEEIKSVMFSIGDDRAPGPDGFTSAFFKKSWDIVGDDICKAVRDFFSYGKLLKETNHTFLALIPKVSTPFRVTDYRPISCCSVLYKCISKILTNRIIEGIKEMVSDSQSAFISGRRISDNILITQELMHNYHRGRGPPRCVFKVDIQKAYDSVDWGFLRNILHCFGFHATMIVNVCFTDDLFIFFRGEVDLARLIMESLEEFQKSLGLVPSIPKSTVYYCNVRNHVKVAILNIMPFAEGELPVKYLGVPLSCVGFLWYNGELKHCKAKMAWDILCLPKCKVGLVMRNSLKTHDQLRLWDVGLNTNLNLLSCTFCVSQPDSHAHLFFECSFSAQMWMYIRHLPGMKMVSSSFHDIVSYLFLIAHRRTTKSIIGGLLIAAASYFIWVERNNRIFKNTRRSPKEIRDSMMVTVRLKLLTFRFKNTTMVNELLIRWKMPKNFRVYV
nr:hypothetical protein [Tanacetum cinerariifolium]